MQMNKSKILAIVCLVILLISFVSFFPLCAQDIPNGMVVKVDGTTAKINMGLNKGLTIGQEFYVVRMGNELGVIKVSQIDEYYSLAEITSNNGGEIKPGDVVTTKKPQPQTQTNIQNNNTQKDNNGSVNTNKTQYTKYGDPLKGFEAEMKKHSRKKKFSIKDSIGKVTEQSPLAQQSKVPLYVADAMDVWSATTMTNYMPEGYAVDPFYYLLLASQVFERHRQAKMVSGNTGSSDFEIEAILWDDSLAQSYADYIIFKEAINDPSQAEMVKKDIINQKGLDSSYVFEVKIRNKSSIPIQLSPFKYHMYLVTPQGVRVKAERYDQALDGSVTSNSELSGFVYFPRQTDVSLPLSTSIGKLRVVFEEVMGNSFEFAW